MRKAGIVLGCVVFFLVVFWVGFALHFPGKAASRLIENRVNRGDGLEVSAPPAELGLTGLTLPGVQVAWNRQRERIPLFTAGEIFIPFSWRLFSGVGLEVTLGKEGAADVFVPWQGGELAVDATGVRLEDFSAWKALDPLKVRGQVALTGRVTLPAPAGRGRRVQPPAGTLNGSVTGVEISNMELVGEKLPPLRLEAVEVGLRLGRQVRLEKGTFRGDFQGTLSGTVVPRGQDYSQAGLNLTLAAAVRQGWLQSLGNLKPIVEAFVKDGRVDGSLTGTMANPRWNASRGRGG